MKKKEIIILALIFAVAVIAIGVVLLVGGGTDGQKESTKADVNHQESTADPAGENGSGEGGLEKVEQPDFSMGLQDNGYFADVQTADCVTLGTYKGIPVPAEEVTLTDEEVDELITEILAEYAEEDLLTNRAVMEGDVLYVDYTGSINGVENSKLSTGVSGDTIDLSDPDRDPAYAEALVGAFCGDTVNVTVVLPDDYTDVTLRGKTVDYEIEIHCIAEYESPELNEAFLQKHYPEYETVEAFIAAQKAGAEKSLLQNYVWNAVVKEAQVEVPQILLDNYAQLQLDVMAYTAYKTYGATLEEYLAVTNYTENTFREDAILEGKSRVATQLIAQAICEAEKLEPAQEDAQTYMGYDAAAFDAICGSYGKGYAHQILLMNKVTAFLIEQAVVE